MRGLKAPPRSTCAPAALTLSGHRVSWGCDSTEHGPAITTIWSPPTGTPWTLNWVLSGWASRLASLKGWRIRTTFSTESSDCSASSCSLARSSPTIPMMVRTSPRERWVLNPSSRTRRETSSMSASLDPGFSTMIMLRPLLPLVVFSPFVVLVGCRLVLQALQLRGPRNGPRTPPGRGHPLVWARRAKTKTPRVGCPRRLSLLGHGLVRRPWLLAISSWEPGGDVGKVKIPPPRSVAAGRRSHACSPARFPPGLKSGASLRARLLPVKPSVPSPRSPGRAPPVEPGHDPVAVVVERQGRRHREGRDQDRLHVVAGRGVGPLGGEHPGPGIRPSPETRAKTQRGIGLIPKR